MGLLPASGVNHRMDVPDLTVSLLFPRVCTLGYECLCSASFWLRLPHAVGQIYSVHDELSFVGSGIHQPARPLALLSLTLHKVVLVLCELCIADIESYIDLAHRQKVGRTLDHGDYFVVHLGTVSLVFELMSYGLAVILVIVASKN